MTSLFDDDEDGFGYGRDNDDEMSPINAGFDDEERSGSRAKRFLLWWRQWQRCGPCAVPRWSFLLLALLVLVLMVLIFLSALGVTVHFALMPFIVQQNVDKGKVTFTSVTAYEPFQSKDGRWHVRTVVEGEIESPGVRMKTTIGDYDAEMLFEGTVVGHTHLPQVHVMGGGKSKFSTDTIFDVASISAWSKMARQLLHGRELTQTMRGKTFIRLDGLFGIEYHGIHIHREITQRAVDNFEAANFTVINSDFSLSNATHIAMSVTTRSYNPTIIQNYLGRLRLDTYFQGVRLGWMEASNVSMLHGYNEVSNFGVLEPTEENLPLIAELMAAYVNNVSLIIDAVAGPNATDYALYNPSMEGVTFHSRGQPLGRNLVEALRVINSTITPLGPSTLSVSSWVNATMYVSLGPNAPVSVIDSIVQSHFYYQGELMGVLEGHMSVADASTTTQIFPSDAILTLTGDPNDLPYVAFATDFLYAASLDAELRGFAPWANVSMPGIPSLLIQNVTLNPTVVPCPALGGLQNTTVVNVDVPANAPDGSGMLLFVTIGQWNPAPSVFVLGTPTFDVYYGDTRMSQVQCDNMTLAPGYNEFTLHGILHPTNLDVASTALSLFYQGLPTTMTSVGTGNLAFPDIPWIQAVALNTRLNATQPGLDPALRAALIGPPTVLPGGSIDFSANGSIQFSALTRGSFSPPYTVPVEILTVMAYNRLVWGGVTVAEFQTPEIAVSYFNFTERVVELAIPPVPLVVHDVAAFEDFAAAFLLNSEVSVLIEGVINTSLVNTVFGNLRLEGTAFANNVTLLGYNAFEGGLNVVSATATAGYAWGFELGVTAMMYNPTPTEFVCGASMMQIFFDASAFGLGWISIGENAAASMSLVPENWTMTEVRGSFVAPNSSEVTRYVLTNFLNGHATPVELRGSQIDAPLLQKGFEMLRINSTLPGSPHALVLNTSVQGVSLFPMEAFVSLNVLNSFNTSVTCRELIMNVSYSYDGKLIGKVNFTEQPITIGMRQSSWTVSVPLVVDSLYESIRALLDVVYEGGHTKVDVVGTILFTIGGNESEPGFSSIVDYEQRGINCYVFAANQTTKDEGASHALRKRTIAI